jgi:hypothetical protein
LNASADASLVVIGNVSTSSLTAAAAVAGLTQGSFTGSAVDAGTAVAITSYGTLQLASATAGGNVSLGSVGDLTANVAAGGTLEAYTFGNLDGDYLAEDDIIALVARGNITGTYLSHDNVDTVFSYGGFDADITAGGTGDPTDPDSDGYGHIRRVAAWNDMDGTLTALVRIEGVQEMFFLSWPRRHVALILGIAILAFGAVFCMHPAYEVSRTNMLLHYRTKASLFRDEDSGEYTLFFRPGVTDSHIRRAVETTSHLDMLTRVRIPSGTVSRGGYSPFTRLNDVEDLRIQHCPITPQGMRDIAKIPTLRRLVLMGMRSDDATLRELRTAQELGFLWIDARMPGHSIDLHENTLDDLCAMKKQSSVWLYGVDVGSDEAEWMRARKPGLELEVID